MKLGMTLAEYEAHIGELNRYYHEYAEMIMLYKQGVLPLENDEENDPNDPSSKRIRQ